MLVRFDIRLDDEGWTVFDRLTGEPALVEGRTPTALTRPEAEEIADLLNTLALIKPEPPPTRH